MNTSFQKIADRKQRAVAGARLALRELLLRGVEAKITGSLARGGFGPDSDVDFLVVKCPHNLKYAIEGVVEDAMDGIPFDVVYLDEIPTRKIVSFTRDAVDASRIR